MTRIFAFVLFGDNFFRFGRASEARGIPLLRDCENIDQTLRAKRYLVIDERPEYPLKATCS